MAIKTELFTRLAVDGELMAPITAWIESDDEIVPRFDAILEAYRVRTMYSPEVIENIERHFAFIRNELLGYSSEQFRVRRSLSMDLLNEYGERPPVSVEYFVWDVNAVRWSDR